MRYYFAGSLFIILYNFCASILRANGDTKGPMLYLTVAGVLNVVLNIFFVTVFHMNVAGVALATVLSFGVSAALALLSLLRRKDLIRLELKGLRIHKEPLKKVLRIGIPAGLQTSLFAIGNIFIQSAINSFDNSLLISGCGAAANLDGFVYLPMNAFQTTTTNFVGQNYGATQYDRVKKVTYTCAACVTLIGLTCSILFYLNGPALLSIYLPNSPEAIEYGMIRMTYICLPYFIGGIMEVLTGALRGMGSSTTPMIISIMGACVFRIVWICVVFQIPVFHTPEAVYFSYPVSWLLTAIAEFIAFLILFKRKSRAYTAQLYADPG
jgi:Na+-driven multidrug efflux pump